MRVTQRLDYTLRLLAALARLRRGTRIAVGELASAMGLPKRFCEQQVTELARHGLVSCRRGAGGGCRLALPAEEVTVAAVARALEGSPLDVPQTSGSATAEMWARVAALVEDELDAITIAELAERQTEIDLTHAPIYHI